MHRSPHTCRHCSFAVPTAAPVCPGCGRPAVDDWRRRARALDRRSAARAPAPLRDEGYRSLLSRARISRASLLLELGLLVLYAFTFAAWWWADPHASFDVAGREVTTGDTALVLAVAILATQAVAAVAFIAWLVRAHRNLPALRVSDRRVPTALVALAWFVPGLNLFLPKVVVNDVVRASSPRASYRDDSSWRRRRVGPVVDRWWASWLIAPAVGVVGYTVAANHFAGVERHVVLATANAAAVLFLLVAGTSARELVGLVTVAQAQRADTVVDLRDGRRRLDEADAARAAVGAEALRH